MFQFPGFASYPYVFRARYPHMITGNPKPDSWKRPQGLRPRSSRYRRWVSPFGNPRIEGCSHLPVGLSQRTTSFIASYRQGIHQMPLGRLIALISNAHLCSHSACFRVRSAPRTDTRLDGHCLERPDCIGINPTPLRLQRRPLRAVRILRPGH